MFTPRIKVQNKGDEGSTSRSGKGGVAAVLKSVKQLASERNFDKAKEILIENIELDPGNSTYLLVMSKILTITKNYNDALIFANRATKADPLNAMALLQQGLIRFKMGEHDESIKSVISSLQLDPRSIKALHLLQRIYSKTNRSEDLLQTCNKCIGIYPFDARSYINKSGALLGKGDIEEAERVVSEAITMIPESSSLYAELGKLHAMQGSHSSAISDYQKSIAEQKTARPLIYLKLAQSFLEVSDYTQCRETLSEFDKSLRSLKRKSLASRIKKRYQYSHDYLYACSLKGQESQKPYQTAVEAILRRMIIDSPNLHGLSPNPISPEMLSNMSFEQIETLVIGGVKTFETKSGLDEGSSDDFDFGFEDDGGL